MRLFLVVILLVNCVDVLGFHGLPVRPKTTVGSLIDTRQGAFARGACYTVGVRCMKANPVRIAMSSSALDENMRPAHQQPMSTIGRVKESIPRVMTLAKKFMVPFVLQLGALYFLGVMPTWARGAKRTAVATTTTTKVKRTFVQKLLNKLRKSQTRDWKIGDTAGDNASFITITMNLVGIALFVVVGSAMAKAKEVKDMNALKEEGRRVREYKENMYFDAVSDIVRKLERPGLKGSMKANLQRELKDLDPTGVIQEFVKNGGERPDLGDMFSKKPKSKKRPAKRKAPPPTATSANTSAKDTSPESTPAPTPAPKKPQPPAVDKNSKSSDGTKDLSVKANYMEVLGKVANTLDGEVEERKIQMLVDYLKSRVEEFEGETRAKNVGKILSKAEDTDYWVSLIAKRKF